MDHNKLWKILQEMGIPGHFTCLLRHLYAGQEATVRTGHGATKWSKIGKGVHQGCILSPFLFNFYSEHVMQNAGLDEAQAEVKTAGRNISNLRYVDDTTIIAESKLVRKEPDCWKRLKAGRGDNRGRDGWMALLIQWT